MSGELEEGDESDVISLSVCSHDRDEEQQGDVFVSLVFRRPGTVVLYDAEMLFEVHRFCPKQGTEIRCAAQVWLADVVEREREAVCSSPTLVLTSAEASTVSYEVPQFRTLRLFVVQALYHRRAHCGTHLLDRPSTISLPKWRFQSSKPSDEPQHFGHLFCASCAINVMFLCLFFLSGFVSLGCMLFQKATRTFTGLLLQTVYSCSRDKIGNVAERAELRRIGAIHNL